MKTPSGTYVYSLQGHRTFIPDPLPPPLTLSAQTQHVVERATHLLGQVEMCRTLLPNADLLIYSSLQREAIASSTIEGTIATPDELVLYQFSDHTEQGAVREVANYRLALEWGCEQIIQLPLATRVILGLHERLLHNVRGASRAGRFKDQQNYIGTRTSTRMEEAIFIPAPPEETPALIATLEQYINQQHTEARVVQCALAHYQFETIHPFGDGNGRVGRLLIILHMIQLQLLSAPLIYPSVYFERTRANYYQELQQVRTDGSWDSWIHYFATGISKQCEETLQFTRMVLMLRQQMDSALGNVRRRASASAVLGAFFHHPVQTTRQIAETSGLASNTVQSVLDTFAEMGFVREISGRQKRRIYVCDPILDAVFGRATQNAGVPDYADPARVQQTLPHE